MRYVISRFTGSNRTLSGQHYHFGGLMALYSQIVSINGRAYPL